MHTTALNALRAALVLAAVTTCGSAAADTSGSINGWPAVLDLDNDPFWDGQLDTHMSQGIVGLQATAGPGQLPLALELGGFLQELSPNRNAVKRFHELSIGLQLRPVSRFVVRPYIGAGLAHLSVEVVDEPPGDQTTTSGFYVHGGLAFRIGPRHRRPYVNLALDVRDVSGTDLVLLGHRGDANYRMYGLLVGFGWDGEHSGHR